MTLIERKEGEEKRDALPFSQKTIGMVLKKVEGLTTADGSPYELEFGSDGYLTPDCVSELMNLDCAAALVTYSGNFALREVKDYGLEGATVDFQNVQTVKKKQSDQTQAG